MSQGDEKRGEYLFVYGTLHPDRAPDEIADLVAQFESVGKGTVAGTLYDLGSYPGAVFDPSSPRRISGTVFRLLHGSDVFSRLDAYEEFDPEAPEQSLFIRRAHPVHLYDGRVLSCWVYEYNGPIEHGAILESGNFV